MFIANRLPVGADLKLKFVALWHVPLCIQKLRFRALWHVPLDIKNFLKVIRKRTEDNVIHVSNRHVVVEQRQLHLPLQVVAF